MLDDFFFGTLILGHPHMFGLMVQKHHVWTGSMMETSGTSKLPLPTAEGRRPGPKPQDVPHSVTSRTDTRFFLDVQF